MLVGILFLCACVTVLVWRVLFVEPWREIRAWYRGTACTSRSQGDGGSVLGWGAALLALILAIRAFVLDVVDIPTPSMEPAIPAGSRLIASKLAYGLRAPLSNERLWGDTLPRRGEVVTFANPYDPKSLYVKRVIAMPGDVVGYVGKTLFVNGNAVTTATAIRQEGTTVLREERLGVATYWVRLDPHKPAKDFGPLTLLPGQYFVMGDNRDDSFDSRNFGPIADEALVGRLTVTSDSAPSRRRQGSG